MGPHQRNGAAERDKGQGRRRHRVDDLSRERVRLAADRISQATGLDLDVTVGASTTQRTLTLPAGNFGRPELALSQPWLKKGVGVAIVLLVCALTVANCVTASVRARQRELVVCLVID